MSEDVYTKKLAKAGVNQTGTETARVYGLEDAQAFLSGQGVYVDSWGVEGKFVSAFVRATKRATACCASGAANND